MNEKCTINNMNNNMHLIGILLLFFILIIVIIYFYKNIINKHCNIIENYVSNTKIRDDYNYNSNYTNYKKIGDLDKKTIQENVVKLRDCQVYFVGEKDRLQAYPLIWKQIDSNDVKSNYILINNTSLSNLVNAGETVTENEETLKIIAESDWKTLSIDRISIYNYLISNDKYYLPKQSMNEYLQKECDKNYENDNNSTCKYVYKDGWKEIDEIGDNKYDKKIYNKDFTNIISQKAMNMCFKENVRHMPKYIYSHNDLVEYNYSGFDDLNNIKLNVSGDVYNYENPVNHINMNFMNSLGIDGMVSNYNNILNNICSIKYKDNDLIKAGDKFIKFHLTKENTLDDTKKTTVVKLNDDFSSFTVVNENPAFISDSIYSIKFEKYNVNTKTVSFIVFKSPQIKSIKNIDIYKFGYNYLCDDKITSVNKKKGNFHVGNLIDNTEAKKTVVSKKRLTFTVYDLKDFNWNKYIVSSDTYENQYNLILKDLINTKKIKEAEIEKEFKEGFTNYKEHFSIDCSSINWKQCPCNDYPNDINNCGTDVLQCLEEEQKRVYDTYMTNRNRMLHNNLLSEIVNIESPIYINACGIEETQTERKPFNFKPGYFYEVIPHPGIDSIESIYGTVRGLNKYGIVVKNEAYEKTTHEHTMHRKFKNTDGYHDVYLDDRKGRKSDIINSGETYNYSNWVNTPEKTTDGAKHTLHSLHHKNNLSERTLWSQQLGKMQDKYAWYYSYKFSPPKTTYYIFWTRSDDGSYLEIRQKSRNNEIIYSVNNGGGHGEYRWVQGRNKNNYPYVYLYKGEAYYVEMSMAEWWGGDSMRLWIHMYDDKRWYNINHTKYMSITEQISGKTYPVVANWIPTMDGGFKTTVSVNSGERINANEIYFTNRKISEPTQNQVWEEVKFENKNEFHSNVQTTDGSTLTEAEKQNILDADSHYKFYIKRESNNKLHFKILHQISGLNKKGKATLFGSENVDLTNSVIVKQSHINITDNLSKYYNINNNDVKTSIGMDGLLEGNRGYKYVVTAFIFLDKGYYKFKTEHNIEESDDVDIIDDGFYISTIHGINSELNKDYIIIKNKENESTDFSGKEDYDYKILESGFYLGCYNCFIFNNALYTIEKESDALEAAITEYNTLNQYDTAQFQAYKNEKKTNLETTISMFRQQLTAELKKTNLEEYNRTEAQLHSNILKLNLINLHDTAEGYVSALTNYIANFSQSEDAIPGLVTVPKTLSLNFNLKADYYSEEHDITLTDVLMNEKMYSGKKIWNFKTKNSSQFHNIFVNVSSFQEVFDAKNDNFTNYIEKFSDGSSATGATGIGTWFDNPKSGNDFSHTIKAGRERNKTKDILRKKQEERDEALRQLRLHYTAAISSLKSAYSDISINTLSYFKPIKIKYNKNVPILNIINNKFKPNESETETGIKELNSYITYEKITDINQRTPDLNNPNYSYKDYSSKSFYISTEGIL